MNTNYLTIWQSSDPKIIGIKNGGSQARIDGDKFSDKSNYDRYCNFFADKSSAIWSKLDKILDFEFVLEYVRLEKNAKLTDFLSYHPTAFRAHYLMSEKAMRVLQMHQLPHYRTYPAKVYYNDNDFIHFSSEDIQIY